MSMTLVYVLIDAHAKHCVLGSMNSRGEFLRTWTFVTCEKELIRHVEAIDARRGIGYGGKRLITLSRIKMGRCKICEIERSINFVSLRRGPVFVLYLS